MANALMGVDQSGLSTDHRQHLAFGTNRRAPLATDAIGDIDVGVLRAWSLTEKLAFGKMLPNPFFTPGLPSYVKEERYQKDNAIYAIDN